MAALGLVLLAAAAQANAQCRLVIEGLVQDEETAAPLPYATVFVQELGYGATTDSMGYFVLPPMCPGTYHLRVSHIGCETEGLFLNLVSDTTLAVPLHHHSELLSEATVHADKHASQASTTINGADIAKESNKSLSGMLEQVAGVSSLKTGSGIAKPVIHGLYGNRIALYNNGILQSGQRWGNDHAPEIDPFVASHLSVVKGASALAYGGNALGGVVLIEVDKIPHDPHLHGQANYLFQLNGLGHTANLQLQQYSKWFAWRITGTYKRHGDYRSPTYYLTNTGQQEADLAVQLEKSITSKWHLSVYYSLYTAETAILRGSQIGNLTDLEQAIGRSQPFFTQPDFSYAMAAPRQAVQHHLVKLESHYLISSKQSLTLKYGLQLNNRKEFDIRRSGRTDTPALSLMQLSHFTEAVHNLSLAKGWTIKTGLQLNYIDNTNNPETGILPLLPDHRQYNPAAFAIAEKASGRWAYNAGARYDYFKYQVLKIDPNGSDDIQRYNPNYHNYSLSAGARVQVVEALGIKLDAGYVLRAPAVNELHSSGLHQGVSGIEEGSANLRQERSFKALLALDATVSNKLFIQAVGYFNHIGNYIYLQPQDSFRLTIRGAFPLFLYEQTDARLLGTDLLVSYNPIKSLKLVLKYALVRGQDISQGIPLVYMPPDNLTGTASYTLKATTFSLNGRYVFRQGRLLPSQDFLAPPEGYFLLGAGLSTKVQLSKSAIALGLAGENLLNTTYRDYLNRQRYFADELGINLVARINYSF